MAIGIPTTDHPAVVISCTLLVRDTKPICRAKEFAPGHRTSFCLPQRGGVCPVLGDVSFVVVDHKFEFNASRLGVSSSL